MGLLNRVVSSDELDAYVEGYTDMMTANAPLSLKTTNLIVNELLKDAADRDMALCHQLVEDCAKSDDLEEGPPRFHGEAETRLHGPLGSTRDGAALGRPRFCGMKRTRSRLSQRRVKDFGRVGPTDGPARGEDTFRFYRNTNNPVAAYIDLAEEAGR